MENKTNVPAVLSLNFAIIGILFSPTVIGGILFSAMALILGIIGITQKNVKIGSAISGIVWSVYGLFQEYIIIMIYLSIYGTLENLTRELEKYTNNL